MHRMSACLPAALAVAAFLVANPSAAAVTYQTNLGPMPLDESNKASIQGRGDATAILDGMTLIVTGSFAGLSSPAMAAHLNVGLAIGVPGTQASDLTVTKAVSGTVSGTLTLTPAQAAAFRTGRLYLQLDSEKAPSGNLWGWLLPQHQDAAADVPQQAPWFLPQLDTPTR